MRFLNSLNRFRTYLRRGRQRPRPEKLRSRPCLEELEGRIVLSTLSIGTGDQAVFSGNSKLFSENLTLSETTVPTLFGPIAKRTFTDPNDTINVIGPGAGSTTGSGTHQVTWYDSPGKGSIVVAMNAYSNGVNVQSNDVGIDVFQGWAGGYLTVNIGSSSNGVQSILGEVNVSQTIDNDTNMYVDDSADTANRPNVTFNGGYLTGLAPAAIHVGQDSAGAGAMNLTVLGGKGLNDFTVTNTLLNNSSEGGSVTLYTGGGGEVNVRGTEGPLYIDNNGGFDSVTVGSAAPSYGGTLADIFGTIDVYGTGSTYLYVDDSGDTTGHIATLTGTSLTGLSPATIEWTPSAAATGGVTFLDVNGSAAGSTYYVNNTPNLHYNTDLSTGAGSDTVFVHGTTSDLYLYNYGGVDAVYVGNGTLAGINGNVFVAGAGSTYLYVEDGSDPTSHTATLTDTHLSGLSQGTIYWSASSSSTGGVTFLDINGSAAGSTYDVTNTPNLAYETLLATGTGSDLVNISGTTGKLEIVNYGGLDEVYVTGNGTLAPIKGLVQIAGGAANGPTYLYVEDIYDTTARTATLTGTSLTGLSPAPIEWTASSSPTGGGVTALVLYGGAANDTYDVASIPSSYYGTTLFGGSGTNTLIGPNTTNTWNITGADAGSLNGSLGFTGMANLVGGTGVDTFRFTAAASQVANINGGGAPVGQGDWLDYLAFPSAVAVNLATGQATGVTGTVHNIQNVFGGNHGATLIGDPQGNILIGGAGADTILGGTGLSLLIGGTGNDTVTGGSGGDILIGGFTTFDQAHNEAALMSILAEWQSGKSYATRVSDLKFGGGLNGSNVLRLGTTVIDDGGADSLTGGSHIPGALDWFFQGAHDKIHNYEGGEQIN
jgi:hypothetical protein